MSLCVNDHNLSSEEYTLLVSELKKFWNTAKSEQIKERLERAILFRYLKSESNPYFSYRIEKTIRPDFILMGGSRIGVEITQLTTESEKVMDRISKDYFGRGKTAEQIKTDAIKQHGRKAKMFSYTDLGEIQAIGSPVYNIIDRKKAFAEQIENKYHKYQAEIPRFDSFIILADGQADMGLTSQADIDDVYNEVKKNEPRISEVTVIILWNDSNRDYISEY